MLPALERLRRTGVFQRAYTGRKSVTTDLATLYVLPRTRPPHRPATADAKSTAKSTERSALAPPQPARLPLVGFVVAKKVCKSAQKRNRAKRRLREAYRLLTLPLRTRMPELADAGKGEDYHKATSYSLDQWYVLVWVIHEKMLTATWQDIVKTVHDSLLKADSKFGASRKSAPQASPGGGGRKEGA